MGKTRSQQNPVKIRPEPITNKPATISKFLPCPTFSFLINSLLSGRRAFFEYNPPPGNQRSPVQSPVMYSSNLQDQMQFPHLCTYAAREEFFYQFQFRTSPLNCKDH